jgi:hypothetical protein
MALVSGTILLGRPSPRKIHQQLVEGGSGASFYRDIHDLIDENRAFYDAAFDAVQDDRRLAMRRTGVLVVDEHVIPHTSNGIEGVSYQYSTTQKKSIAAISIITMHYRCSNVEYPVSFDIYRRYKELQACDKTELYREKNAIVREMFRTICGRKNSPSLVLMDSFFMTKENVLELKQLGVNYVSRPKRNWCCNYKHKPYSMEELFDSIPLNEFVEVKTSNKKGKQPRIQKVAIRDVFFSKIGKHRVVFIDCTKESRSEADLDGSETKTTASGRKFRLFVTDVLTWDAATILKKYAHRWAIETSYQDMSQNLALHGCKWRELRAQYFFIALTFLCYLFLAWTKVHGHLSRHGSSPRTIGQLKQGFTHYCQEEYTTWHISQNNDECSRVLNQYILQTIYCCN